MAARGSSTTDTNADDQGTVAANAALAGIGAADDGQVTVKMSHYLGAEQGRLAGLPEKKDGKDYVPGEDVKVSRDVAASMITQGYVAGVNPQDSAQVRKALGLKD